MHVQKWPNSNQLTQSSTWTKKSYFTLIWQAVPNMSIKMCLNLTLRTNCYLQTVLWGFTITGLHRFQNGPDLKQTCGKTTQTQLAKTASRSEGDPSRADPTWDPIDLRILRLDPECGWPEQTEREREHKLRSSMMHYQLTAIWWKFNVK